MHQYTSPFGPDDKSSPNSKPVARVSPMPRATEVSEHSVALDFTAKYRGTLRYCPELGSWFEWDEVRWRPDRLARAFHYARELAGSASGTKIARKAGFARGVESFCRADPAHAVEASYWDSDDMLLGTPTGTVDLKARRILGASQKTEKIVRQATGSGP